MKKLETLKFKKFCMTIGNLPASYVDSMSYYECLLWLIKYLQEEVIPTVNNNSEAVTELQGLFIELQTYVANYFANLDVQEEINNKLDEMVEEGTLQEIIADYLNSKAVFGYDTVADMKLSTNLIDGSYAKTLGYHTKNDKGGALYRVREITNQDIVDESTIIALADNELIAELISDKINVMQFGAYGDGTHADEIYFQKAINYAKSKSNELNIQVPVYVPNNIYKISDTVELPILQVDLIGDEAEIQTYIEEGEKPVFHLMGEALKGSIRKIEGFTFRNKAENTSTSTLFFIGSTTYTEGQSTDVGAQFTISKCYFLHYGYAILTGNNSYLYSLNECNSGGCYSVIKNKYAYNTGENISINKCILTAFTKCLDITLPNFQINCNDTSFDAGQQVLYMYSSTSSYKGNLINFNNCHFEPTTLDVPLIEIASGDISKVNITKCTSFINTNMDYIFKLNNNNQFLNLENNFFTFGTKPPKYLCNHSNIYCKGNDYQINILKNTTDNLFNDNTLNYTNIENSLITQGKDNVYTDKYYIFRDNTSYNTGVNRLTSTNCTLTLDSSVKPDGMNKSVKVTTSDVADIIVCACAHYKGQDSLKGSIKVMFPETLTGKVVVNFCYWNSKTTYSFISNFKEEIDLSTITPNEWITIDIPTQAFHVIPEGKYWGFQFSIIGNNKPSTSYTYYIADPIIQNI